MSSFLVVVVAVFVDRLLGEPASYHPLRGFAKIASLVERFWHRQEDQVLPEGKNAQQLKKIVSATVKVKGALAVLFLVLPFMSIAAALDKITIVNFICDSALLYLCLGAHSLRAHAMAVQKALSEDDIESARIKVGLMVSSDTSTMNKEDILLACTQSILENGNDAVLAPIFWFVVLGAPGAILYRLVNTLDAMWGYKNIHYQNFGWAAAKLDNLLNWIPIRLTAVSYILLGDIKAGWRSLVRQAKTWYVPDAAPVLAAGAGTLGIDMSGLVYNERLIENNPRIGLGKRQEITDISRCCDLVERAIILWLAINLVFSLSHC